MTVMDKENVKDGEANAFSSDSKKTLFFKKEKNCVCGYYRKNQVEVRPEILPRASKAHSNTPWFQYALYAHIIVLYILLLTVYNELRFLKDTMYDFHMNMINVSVRGMEVEKNCLLEISSFRSSLESNNRLRSKRDAIETSTWQTFGSGLDMANYDLPKEDIPHSRVTRKVENQRRGKEIKKNKSNRRRRCHSRNACGFPRATHFIGALPEPIIRDGGLLAPWLVDKNAVRDFSLNTKVPTRGREAVEVIEHGLYFIYAQVYYMSPKNSTRSHASFSLVMDRPGSGESVLAQCATLGDSSVGGEASCFTGTAQTLQAGDVLFLRQRERDRHILMQRGQTYLGLVLLNKRVTDKPNQNSDVIPTITTSIHQ